MSAFDIANINQKKRIQITAAACLSSLILSGCSQQNFGLVPQQQSFAQNVTYAKTADVLWVVDTSGSMDKRRAQLAAQIPTFVTALNQTGLDYQMAMITMDLSASGGHGNLLAQTGTDPILKKSTPNLAAVLAERFIDANNGSPVNQGEAAMQLALTKNSASWKTQGFLRPNSLLVLVMLSDQEDASPDGDYTGYLDALRPPLASGERSWVAQFMGVLPNDPACQTSDWGFSSPGRRFMALAEASGGASESICDADFSRALTNVKSRILEVVTEYFFDGTPVVSSISVNVDGISVPSDEMNGWTYNTTRNSILFHGSAIPKPGASIKVNFRPNSLK